MLSEIGPVVDDDVPVCVSLCHHSHVAIVVSKSGGGQLRDVA